MSEEAITTLLINLINQLPPELRSSVSWLAAHYDSVGRPVLTLGFTVVLLVQIAIVALVWRALMPAARDGSTHRP